MVCVPGEGTGSFDEGTAFAGVGEDFALAGGCSSGISDLASPRRLRTGRSGSSTTAESVGDGDGVGLGLAAAGELDGVGEPAPDDEGGEPEVFCSVAPPELPPRRRTGRSSPVATVGVGVGEALGVALTGCHLPRAVQEFCFVALPTVTNPTAWPDFCAS